MHAGCSRAERVVAVVQRQDDSGKREEVSEEVSERASR